MKPTSDASQQSALAALLQQAQQYKPRTRQLRAAASVPVEAAIGEVWLTKALDKAEAEPEEPQTVLIIKRFEGDVGEPTIFTAAPIFSDPRMAGPADAVLPQDILGFEAGIAFASAASILPESLVTCEGALPEDWIYRLAAFYDYVGGIAQDPPHGVTTGAPYIDSNDPAFIFHEDLAEQMQALAMPVLKWATGVETNDGETLGEKVGTLSEISVSQTDFTDSDALESDKSTYPLEFDPEFALAAGESNLPEQIDVSHLLPAFTGFARGSVRSPGEATVFTFSCPVQRASPPPMGIVVSWPGGASMPCLFRENFGRWMTEIEIELRWKDSVALLAGGKVVIAQAQ